VKIPNLSVAVYLPKCTESILVPEMAMITKETGRLKLLSSGNRRLQRDKGMVRQRGREFAMRVVDWI
jgi:hypothetical protein